MEDMQEKLNSILGNPEMMQKIAAMAQSMQMPSAPPQEQPDPEPFEMPNIDIGMIQKLSGFASQSGIDKNQKNLLTDGCSGRSECYQMRTAYYDTVSRFFCLF